MDMTIRNATIDDYDSVCELFSEVDALHRRHLPHMFQQPGGPALEKGYFLELIADEKVALLVAQVGERLVGYLHAVLRDAPALPILVPRRYAVVDAVGVSSGFRDRLIGKKLMHEAQTWAIAKGATSIELNVYEFNAGAIAFYEKLGYHTLSRKMSKELGKDSAAG